MSTKHGLTPSAFTNFACGIGDREGIEVLRAVALSRHMLSIAGLVGFAQTDYRELGLRAGIDQNVALLEALQERHSAIAQEVLSYPQVGAWANSTLRDIQLLADNPDLLVAHFAHLGNVVAAIALQCGEPFEVVGAIRHGAWRLPSLGSFEVPSLSRFEVVSITSDGTNITVSSLPDAIPVPADLAVRSCNWRPLGRIRAEREGLVFDCALDDTDSFAVDIRIGAGDVVADTELANWQAVFQAGWHILVEHHREYAEAISAGVRVLVPLRSRGVNEDRSNTAADAFGSMMLTMPRDPLVAAEVLVHEFQHGQLDGVMRLYDLLFESPIAVAMYAPWRDDPRPPSGLMQGVYAFMGVTDFWRVQCDVLTGDPQRRAWYNYVRWYQPTLDTLQALLASGQLAELGLSFLDAMRQTMEAWPKPEVPAELREVAQWVACDHWLSWQLRHTVLPPSLAWNISRDWLAGRPCPAREYLQMQIEMGGSLRESQARLDLVRLRVEHPADFAHFALAENWAELTEAIPGVTPVDLAYAQDDLVAAIEGYEQEIAAAFLRIQSWVGLALARARRDGDTLLLDNLPLVFAIARELYAAGHTLLLADLPRIAAWIG